MSNNPHYIDNQWIQGTGLPFISRNPATEAMIWQGNAAAQPEVSAAVDAAKKAFPEWSNKSLDERITYLKEYEKILREKINELAESISKSMGKPLWESKNEVTAMIGKIEISINAYHQRCPTTSKTLSNGQLKVSHKPIGTLAVFGPFNFPGHLPQGHIIPALLAGNTVVFKPSESTPMVAELMMKYWELAKLPPGVINMVQGARETGRHLAGHPLIDGICFTGSWETGVILSEQYAKKTEKILALEMGGNNPLIVDDVADIDAAVLATIQSAYLTSGQRCSCARRVIVTKNEKGLAFIEALIKQIEKIKVGPYTDNPEPFMGPVVSENTAKHLLAAQEALISKGGKSLVKMQLLKVDTALLSPGLIDVTSVYERPDTEIFGPLLQLIRVKDLQHAIAEANNTSFGLTAGILTDDEQKYREFYRKAKAGVINWNAPLTGASSEAPFGGIGRSGNHRPSAFYAADYCSYPVASIENPKLEKPSKPIPGLGN